MHRETPMDTPAASRGGRIYRVRVLNRAFTRLNALEANGSKLGLAELSGQPDLHRATVHRLLMTVECKRYIERNFLRKGEAGSLLNTQSQQIVRTPPTVARRAPVRCTLNTIARLSLLEFKMSRIRWRGYAVDDRKIEEALSCIVAPVRDRPPSGRRPPSASQVSRSVRGRSAAALQQLGSEQAIPEETRWHCHTPGPRGRVQRVRSHESLRHGDDPH